VYGDCKNMKCSVDSVVSCKASRCWSALNCHIYMIRSFTCAQVRPQVHSGFQIFQPLYTYRLRTGHYAKNRIRNLVDEPTLAFLFLRESED
jgi:hypothetical protein